MRMAEETALRRTCPGALVWASTPCAPGPCCTRCDKRVLALVRNDCGHEACDECWEEASTAQIEICREELRLRQRCCHPHCPEPLGPLLWRRLGACAGPLSGYYREVEQRLERLRSTAKQVLRLAPSLADPGPRCQVCFELRSALLVNPDCGHDACEDCWTRWAEEQLPNCRGTRSEAMRCLGPRCQQTCHADVWRHASTLSKAVEDLDAVLQRRKRLQANPLYPASVQVECPRAECLGLGYLGFDSVMCFLCEHQWTPTSGEAPEGLADDALPAGEVAKQCPGCGEHIIKNGGCDHMTCRCKFEFWWSSLEPCRREAMARQR